MDEIAGEVFGDAVPSIERYVDILTTRGVEWGLMGPKEAPRIWGRHIFNSAALSTLMPEGCQVADVGSGAGLPGIPLAIARPDIRITLIEPLLRRSNFLTGVVEELGLGDRVDVLRGRAEDVGQHFDIVTARAVAKLPTLVGWTRGLIGQGGELLGLKGASAQEELDNAQKVLKKYHLAGEVLVVRAHPDTEVTHVVRITKQ
ncbi:Ribosomal RNA small subunit methyltransferase G [Acidipropionibacterium acidipropionici ATCC 4875]|uniref:Ribosomal RNA small subunit methyltransferase G n=1 Tax=Acidipropionibacterium acidipropionici (strain ATCC 4875 / DSM 20272 / JCM 6432 / NBRC 12425 / NCIMB 8070 / 4) TaxID=1171373 RepID=K7RSW9_ACIA4|nr:16S rRNA (guanine(527)-N(7))-methyltransferase RsmG [Acidipropionibacterium acidipropionici]AFV91184.1 Ribosomal RNA small subunit methyltransferase G [Acidipropionibacterium acidipropionici ATCC 4875]